MKRRTFLQLFGLSAMSTKAIAKITEDDIVKSEVIALPDKIGWKTTSNDKGELVFTPTEQQNTYAVKYYTRCKGKWEEISYL